MKKETIEEAMVKEELQEIKSREDSDITDKIEKIEKRIDSLENDFRKLVNKYEKIHDEILFKDEEKLQNYLHLEKDSLESILREIRENENVINEKLDIQEQKFNYEYNSIDKNISRKNKEINYKIEEINNNFNNLYKKWIALPFIICLIAVFILSFLLLTTII